MSIITEHPWLFATWVFALMIHLISAWVFLSRSVHSTIESSIPEVKLTEPTPMWKSEPVFPPVDNTEELERIENKLNRLIAGQEKIGSGVLKIWKRIK